LSCRTAAFVRTRLFIPQTDFLAIPDRYPYPGLSLSLVSGASATTDESTDMLARSAKQNQEITLAEEEIADVTLATFYVFDKEGPVRGPSIQLAAAVGRRRCGVGGCRCGCGASKTIQSQSSGTTLQTPATKSGKARR